jgi:N-acetylneuraminic acid mutarotase
VQLLALVMAAAALAVTGATAPAAAEPASAAAKVKPKLARQLEAKGEATFWIRFEQADLFAASKIDDWEKRGQAVYDTLTKAAEERQKEVRSLLDDSGASYQSFWATNAIRVDAGSQELAADIAAMPEVTALYPQFEYRLEEPKKGKAIRQPNAVEWGIANINADDVWSQFGTTGEGIVVGNIDTGVQFDHPALVDSYRGNNGDGTFDHNYNWFDAAGTCGESPCDNNGHGTHTMGTMAGDDGAGNQIGVAPGVKWIAANGCCPSDAALIASGEWMLAPTDLNGDNPDTTKRPDVINNSWGTTVPSNDPFMEDVIAAWEAAGIFGTWSNGNSGPSCSTSGAPGSRILTYSVGAYDVNNNIAGFSARGPGQDGEIKPNIAAPGVNVRSSVPGNGYQAFNGTSMAAPHLGGTIALLWSAAPGLIGDIPGTRQLLDDTAIDVDDTTCGGTADDNNVWGEGRLDALALLQAAPVGDAGTVEGTVTDAASGDPLEDATIAFAGPSNRSTTTGDDGSYSIQLSAGDYEVTVSKFGYETETTTLTVVAGETTTSDHALTAAASVTLSGTVADGSGHDWPLYASVDVAGPADDTWTDPETGEYSVTVPANASYDVTITADYPGYNASSETITIGDGDTTHDVALTVDTATCLAPGYQFNTEGVTESFDSTETPPGWAVVDHAGTEQVWLFDNPSSRDNLTGGSGNFAIMDSDYYGSTGVQDTSLVSPEIDMSSLTAPVVGFKQDYNNLGDIADVDVSVDGGETWETVLHQTTSVRGPREDVVQLPMAAGEPDVQVRFHNHEADFDWWWMVDDVFIGNRTCDPIPGGLVLGNVRDVTSGDGINGATVTNLDAPDINAKTKATPDDENLDDGFYWMFSSQTGTHPFEATANQYSSDTQDVRVIRDLTYKADFELGAGHLVVTPTSLSATRGLGKAPVEKTFRVTNDGVAPVEVEFTEKRGGFEMQKADGSTTSRSEMLTEKGAPLKLVKGTFSPLSQAAAGGKAGGKAAGKATPDVAGPHEDPWTSLADYPQRTMDAGAAVVDGLLYSFGGFNGADITGAAFVYDPATLAWSPIASMPDGRENPAVSAIDGVIYITGGWLPDGSNATSTLMYDPASDSYTGVADQPVGVAAPGRAVLDGLMYLVGGCQDACGMTDVQVYDPAADSWTELADYPEPISHVACGAIDGSLYCAGGSASASTKHGYVYDPGSDTWSPIADLPIDLWAMGYSAANGQLLVSGGVTDGFATLTNQGFAYDPGSDSWSELPNSNNTLYRGGSACGLYKVGGSSGGFSPVTDVEVLPGMEDCGEGGTDVEWLSVSPATATVAPGESVTVTVTMDPDVAQPGTYSAAVGIKENAPGSVDPVHVTMTVTPPKAWGKLAGTVNGRSCQGDVAPIPGATLQVDSWAGSWTFETEADGSYAYWFNAGANPLQLIAAKDGYQPQTKQVRLKKGKTVRGDFTLRRSGC